MTEWNGITLLKLVRDAHNTNIEGDYPEKN